MKRAASKPARRRPRAKPASAAASIVAEAPAVMAATPEPANLDPLEGKLFVALGVLFVVTALFPRTFKQLLTLLLGGGLLYRGLVGHGGGYRALGVDTKADPTLPRGKS